MVLYNKIIINVCFSPLLSCSALNVVENGTPIYKQNNDVPSEELTTYLRIILGIAAVHHFTKILCYIFFKYIHSFGRTRHYVAFRSRTLCAFLTRLHDDCIHSMSKILHVIYVIVLYRTIRFIANRATPRETRGISKRFS